MTRHYVNRSSREAHAHSTSEPTKLRPRKFKKRKGSNALIKPCLHCHFLSRELPRELARNGTLKCGSVYTMRRQKSVVFSGYTLSGCLAIGKVRCTQYGSSIWPSLLKHY